MPRLSFIALVCLGVVAASSAPTMQSTTVTLSVPGRPSSTPWIASSGAFVAVAWSAGGKDGGDVFTATSTDGGRTFGAPVQVNVAKGEARVSGEIAPRVSLSPRNGQAPAMTVTWNAKNGGTQIKTARSTDGGRTFSAATALQAPGAAGDRGWQASTVDAAGQLHTVWLDHRGMAAAGEHDMLTGEHDGVAMAQRSGLYYRGADAERELFKGVCYCCKTALAVGSDGAIYAAWRHVFDGNLRDIAFTSSRDGGKTFTPLARVNEDGWKIDGCPDDGPAMVVDRSGILHLVWPTVTGEKGVIHYATSRDGRTFSKPVQVPTFGSPKASHPQIALDGSGAIVIAWDEVRDGVRTAGYVDRTDRGFGTPQSLGKATMYPVMAAAERGLVAAWTAGPPNQTTIGVRRMR